MARPSGRAPALRTNLTQSGGSGAGLDGRPVADVARETLAAGGSLVAAWRELEPIVRSLTAKVKTMAESDEIEGYEAAKLLGLVARVVNQVGAASQGILRATEGQHRLALLLSGGIERPNPKQLTERQLAAMVVETVKVIAKERGSCPICVKTVESEANGHAD